ncbi:M48 family metallopeptidase [Candidatus Woesebacteria bacterium]|nr:M48 family metallopeptidase [Candidatus Woesebacteria bacterium]
MVNVYEAVDANKRKSILIVALFFIFVTLVVYVLSQATAFYLGYSPGGLGFVGMALVVSGLMSLAGYYFSDKIVLSISGARPANRKKDFTFFTVVENLCIATGLPKPKLYVIDDSAPNAFATGRDPEHSAVCATNGLLEKLDRTELEGVIGHELSHVKNYDTRLLAVVAVLVGMVALLGDWFLRMSWFGRRNNDEERGSLGAIFILLGIVFAILSPIIAQLIQLAVSRRRELLADAGSVEITRQPEGLISALEKISDDKAPLKEANKATAPLYIVNPIKERGHGGVGWFANLFNTHPPISERIKVLKEMV